MGLWQILLWVQGLRNDQGIWIIGFAKYVGTSRALQAELWVIFLGLNIALQINRNFNIEIETYSSQAINLKNTQIVFTLGLTYCQLQVHST